MESPDSSAAPRRPWTSLWVVALISFVAQLGLCQFFAFGVVLPMSLDVDPSNLWKIAYHFPPTGTFQVLNWLGIAYAPQPLNPLSLAAATFPMWLFFTAYAPLMATCALLAMAAVLRELELSRPAALFGAVIFAWQGDILPFIYPGHYGYITAWPFFALAVWSALRAVRTLRWPYAVISGVCCGTMVGLLTNADRGGIASLLIAAIYLTAIFRAANERERAGHVSRLALCIAVAAVVALASLLALFKSNISGVKMNGTTTREDTYKIDTQFSLGPAETLTFLVPGVFGWHMNSREAPYWGWIGEWPDYPTDHQGSRNLNLAISTTGTIATALALIGAVMLIFGGAFGPSRIPQHQRVYGRLLLALGLVALVLSWGWHTGFYRPLFALPLMDKWRNPLKWIEITNFAIVVLGAVGMQRVLDSLDPVLPGVAVIRRRLTWFGFGLAVVLALGSLWSYGFTLLLRPILESEGFNLLEVVEIIDTVHVAIFFALLLVVLACIVVGSLWHADKLRGWKLVNPLLDRAWANMMRAENLPATLAVALALLAVLQLSWVAKRFIEPMHTDVMTETNPLLERLRHEGNTVRVSVDTHDPMLQTLLQNQFAAMGISSLEVSAASRIPERFQAFLDNFSDDRARLLFLAGVRNVAGPQDIITEMRQDTGIAPNIASAEGYTLTPTGSPDEPSHAVVVLKDYLAKATFVSRAEFLDSDDAILKRLKDSAWNPRGSILLEGTGKESPGKTEEIPALPSKPAKTAKATTAAPVASAAPLGNEIVLQTYTPTEIVIQVRAASDGYVLVNDQYDPDWSVTINGKPAQLLRADYLLRAVPVPAGESTVAMHFTMHYSLFGFPVPAETMNNISDAAMLGAWLIAGLTLRRRVAFRKSASFQQEKMKE